jgi:hypothetical protein
MGESGISRFIPFALVGLNNSTPCINVDNYTPQKMQGFKASKRRRRMEKLSRKRNRRN